MALKPTSETAASVVDIATARTHLEHLLQERQSVLRELEPRALPNVDPVAYQTAASNRQAVEQIIEALDPLDTDTHGRCTRCGEQIESPRV